MIELNQFEKQWILFCKGQLKDKYTYTKGKWVDVLKPLFIDIYGWNPDEDKNYSDYLKCLFNKLLDIYMKIKEEQSSENAQLKELFYSSFYKKFSDVSELPIERTINKLCHLIMFVVVIDSEGNKRFELN
jgi:hypothetical protein